MLTTQTRKKRRRIMVAKEVLIDIIQFERMYKSNIQAHIDYEAAMAGLHDKSKSTLINPGKKHESFKEFYEAKMHEYSEVNYGDIVLTEGGKEIHRVKSNFKHHSVFKNPVDTKPTAGSFPKAHEKNTDSNTQKRFRK